MAKRTSSHCDMALCRYEWFYVDTNFKRFCQKCWIKYDFWKQNNYLGERESE